MATKKGMTKTEVLVVIAGMVLLMGMALPVISSNRQAERQAVCQSNLRQWGIIFTLYTNENNNKFMSGNIDPTYYNLYTRGAWIVNLNTIKDFNNKRQKIRLCPEATKTESEGAAIKTPACAWDYRISKISNQPGEIGSYGLNLWLYNVPKPASLGSWWHGDLRKGTGQEDDHWKTRDIANANQVPMFLDSWWPGGRPETLQDFSGMGNDSPTNGIYLTNGPPASQTSIISDQYHDNDEMAHFVVDRHGGTVNCVFVDNSARQVGLKELWALKWHRSYNTQNNYMKKSYSENHANWADFMKTSKDFYTWQ